MSTLKLAFFVRESFFDFKKNTPKTWENTRGNEKFYVFDRTNITNSDDIEIDGEKLIQVEIRPVRNKQ